MHHRTTLHDTLQAELKNALDHTPNREVSVKKEYGEAERFKATALMVQDALKGLKLGGTGPRWALGVNGRSFGTIFLRMRQPLCSILST
jgi:hypothetical protein